MALRNFKDLVAKKWDEGHFLCVGLDTDVEKIPKSVRTKDVAKSILAFNQAIVDATKDIVCAFKPNSAFYEAEGIAGWQALKDTVDYILRIAPDVPLILDAKRGDIGNTNNGYVKMAFDSLGVDAITVQPYAGGEALSPFFERREKGIFVLVKTSNSGSDEFQNLKVDGELLYKRVTRAVVEDWNKHGNCGVVVGTTYPEEMREVRAIARDMPILMPGTGVQGGDLKQSVKAAKNSKGQGMIISASRAVLYASGDDEFAEAARSKAQEYDSAIRNTLIG